MAKNPDKQQRLRKELKNVATDANGRLTQHSFNSTPYLTACVKEALRIAPVVMGTVRQLPIDLILHGYQIPKGVSKFDLMSILIQILI